MDICSVKLLSGGNDFISHENRLPLQLIQSRITNVKILLTLYFLLFFFLLFTQTHTHTRFVRPAIPSAIFASCTSKKKMGKNTSGRRMHDVITIMCYYSIRQLYFFFLLLLFRMKRNS